MAESHATKVAEEGKLVNDTLVEDPVAEAARLHHLATADPEPERDGVLLSVEHEEKYNLERASDLSVPEVARAQRKVQSGGKIETAAAARPSK
jgi:hypothetical protein